MSREPGFYWVNYLGSWEVARCNGNGGYSWYVTACSDPFTECDFIEIGPRVPTPEELQRLHKIVEVSKAYCSHVQTTAYESTPQRGALIRSIDTSIPNHCEVCRKLLAFDGLIEACRTIDQAHVAFSRSLDESDDPDRSYILKSDAGRFLKKAQAFREVWEKSQGTQQ